MEGAIPWAPLARTGEKVGGGDQFPVLMTCFAVKLVATHSTSVGGCEVYRGIPS